MYACMRLDHRSQWRSWWRRPLERSHLAAVDPLSGSVSRAPYEMSWTDRCWTSGEQWQATTTLSSPHHPIFSFMFMCNTNFIIIHSHALCTTLLTHIHNYRPPRPRVHPKPRSLSPDTCFLPRRCALSSRRKVPIWHSVRLVRSWVHVGVLCRMMRRPSTRNKIWHGSGDDEWRERRHGSILGLG